MSRGGDDRSRGWPRSEDIARSVAPAMSVVVARSRLPAMSDGVPMSPTGASEQGLTSLAMLDKRFGTTVSKSDREFVADQYFAVPPSGRPPAAAIWFSASASPADSE